jgi:endonuclease YncB( thermonuclease family)
MKNYLMRNAFLIFLLFLFPTALLAADWKVTRVYDGDTILVARDRTVARKVRLVGIDAPETSSENGWPEQPYSEEAKKYLTSLVLYKTVSIISYDLDVHNLISGIVYWEGININLEMVRSGLAEVYRGQAPKGFDLFPYRDAEKQAKAAMRGMWSLGDKYISPIEWRRIQTEKRRLGPSDSSKAQENFERFSK